MLIYQIHLEVSKIGIRPVVIVQNDVANKYSPTVIVVPITSKNKKNIPTHIRIDGNEFRIIKRFYYFSRTNKNNW